MPIEVTIEKRFQKQICDNKLYLSGIITPVSSFYISHPDPLNRSISFNEDDIDELIESLIELKRLINDARFN